jgi:lysophospholipase L1-like esterase
VKNKTDFRFWLGVLAAIPLLPLLYFQGRAVKRKVPRLPEAANPEGVAGDFQDRKNRVLFIGESTFAGVGVAYHEDGFAGALANQLAQQLQSQIHWKVFARSGYTARKIRERILPLTAGEEADLIVIGLGGNDAFELNLPRNWKLQIRKLIAALRKQFGQTPIVFTHMPPIKDFPAFTPLIHWSVGNLVEQLGATLAEIVEDEPGVYYPDEVIRLSEWVKRFDEELHSKDFFSDGVHPSALTYRLWAADLSRFIDKMKVVD